MTNHHIICPACQHKFICQEKDDDIPKSTSEPTEKTSSEDQGVGTCTGVPGHAPTCGPTCTSPSSLRSEGDTGVGAQMRRPTHPRKDLDQTFLSAFPKSFRANTQFRQVWRDFAQCRKDRNKKLTKLGVTRIVNKIKEVSVQTAIDMINQSIERSWTGIFHVQPQFDAPAETSSGPKPSAEQKRRFYEGGGGAAVE